MLKTTLVFHRSFPCLSGRWRLPCTFTCASTASFNTSKKSTRKIEPARTPSCVLQASPASGAGLVHTNTAAPASTAAQPRDSDLLRSGSGSGGGGERRTAR